MLLRALVRLCACSREATFDWKFKGRSSACEPTSQPPALAPLRSSRKVTLADAERPWEVLATTSEASARHASRSIPSKAGGGVGWGAELA